MGKPSPCEEGDLILPESASWSALGLWQQIQGKAWKGEREGWHLETRYPLSPLATYKQRLGGQVASEQCSTPSLGSGTDHQQLLCDLVSENEGVGPHGLDSAFHLFNILNLQFRKTNWYLIGVSSFPHPLLQDTCRREDRDWDSVMLI